MDNAVKDFLVNVLGCRCSEEVFLEIDLNKAPMPVGAIPLVFEIHAGGRLIILGVSDKHVLSSLDALNALVAAGAKIRDDRKYNRFRLVVLTDDPDCEAKLRLRFMQLPGLDDRIHMHVVNKDDISFQKFYKAVKERSGHMDEMITEPTRWHEMEGPIIGGREHYQERSYGGFQYKREPCNVAEKTCTNETPGEEPER
jgi:hypothetical protein